MNSSATIPYMYDNFLLVFFQESEISSEIAIQLASHCCSKKITFQKVDSHNYFV